MNEKLIRLRKAAQLSQYDVAARLGIVRTAVTNWERGRNGPSKRIIRRVAELYGCSVEDLLEASRTAAEVSRRMTDKGRLRDDA